MEKPRKFHITCSGQLHLQAFHQQNLKHYIPSYVLRIDQLVLLIILFVIMYQEFSTVRNWKKPPSDNMFRLSPRFSAVLASRPMCPLRAPSCHRLGLGLKVTILLFAPVDYA